MSTLRIVLMVLWAISAVGAIGLRSVNATAGKISLVAMWAFCIAGFVAMIAERAQRMKKLSNILWFISMIAWVLCFFVIEAAKDYSIYCIGAMWFFLIVGWCTPDNK